MTSKSLRPHIQRRDGETIEQWHYWLAYSCYRYGGEFADLTVLNVQENLSTPCSTTTSRGRFIHHMPQDAPDAPDHVKGAWCQKIFRNKNNSIRSIIARRWTGLQLSERVVTTIRIRDPTLTIPVELVTPSTEDSQDVVVSGRVTDADSSNLFPRKFSLITQHGHTDIYILWWKFSTPVRDGDVVTLCGSLIATKSHPVVRLTDFTQHWLKIED